MKRFTWWRMEQDAHHLSRALCGAFCSILHHVKRFLSQPPYQTIADYNFGDPENTREAEYFFFLVTQPPAGKRESLPVASSLLPFVETTPTL